MTRSNGMHDIDDLITGSLRDRAARAPGRAPGMSGVRRRVRRRQQRHAVLAVAPMALMTAFLTTRDRGVGVLPAAGVDSDILVDDTTAMSESPTTDAAIDCWPTVSTIVWEGTTTIVADVVVSTSAPSDAPTTSLGGQECVDNVPTTTMAPEATASTVETVDWNDPALNATSTTVPETTSAP